MLSTLDRVTIIIARSPYSRAHPHVTAVIFESVSCTIICCTEPQHSIQISGWHTASFICFLCSRLLFYENSVPRLGFFSSNTVSVFFTVILFGQQGKYDKIQNYICFRSYSYINQNLLNRERTAANPTNFMHIMNKLCTEIILK